MKPLITVERAVSLAVAVSLIITVSVLTFLYLHRYPDGPIDITYGHDLALQLEMFVVVSILSPLLFFTCLISAGLFVFRSLDRYRSILLVGLALAVPVGFIEVQIHVLSFLTRLPVQDHTWFAFYLGSLKEDLLPFTLISLGSLVLVPTSCLIATARSPLGVIAGALLLGAPLCLLVLGVSFLT